jgi:transcription elongation GreA/GreB family factor
MEDAISAFKNMEVRAYGPDDPIEVGALVELEQGGERSFFFVATRAGGMEITHEKKEVLVITPGSPLGRQIQGKKQGAVLQLSQGGALRHYRVVKVS